MNESFGFRTEHESNSGHFTMLIEIHFSTIVQILSIPFLCCTPGVEMDVWQMSGTEREKCSTACMPTCQTLHVEGVAIRSLTSCFSTVNIFSMLDWSFCNFFVSRAALFDQTKLITFLVEKGAKVNARDDDGRSPFLIAVAAGNIDSARVLLQLGAENTVTDLLLKTSVHLAVEKEHLTMLSMLLESRSGTNNLYKADLWDRVPLHYAAKSKNIKVRRWYM